MFAREDFAAWGVGEIALADGIAFARLLPGVAESGQRLIADQKQVASGEGDVARRRIRGCAVANGPNGRRMAAQRRERAMPVDSTARHRPDWVASETLDTKCSVAT
ncbi:MAG: hypothetical protein B7733_26425 [Myxococcales bacterium FL481]|nr:MAG: hypothetical protein B7733_26425 [Myxococcales bacterium FL481]